MLRKDVGYVNKEIDIALDRQSVPPIPRVFLIPAIIDDPANSLDRVQTVCSRSTSSRPPG